MGLRKTANWARRIATLCALAVLCALMVRTMRSWHRFDWHAFYTNARYISVGRGLAALAFIYAGFLLRAFRWRAFLQSVKDVSAARLFGPTVIGFSGLAIMGYPGELIRPCLIARREKLSISSQMAALTLERIFDLMSVGVLISATILVSSDLRLQSVPAPFRRGAFLLIAFVALLALFALSLAKKGEEIGLTLQRLVSPISPQLGLRLGALTKVFGADLNLIRDAKSLAQLATLSVAIWFSIALAYLETLHAFGALRSVSLAQAVLLLTFALMGSLVQLPAGGTQQAIIVVALISVFRLPIELAASCAILLWLTIIMAPVPLGLALTWRERSSLRTLLRSPAKER